LRPAAAFVASATQTKVILERPRNLDGTFAKIPPAVFSAAQALFLEEYESQNVVTVPTAALPVLRSLATSLGIGYREGLDLDSVFLRAGTIDSRSGETPPILDSRFVLGSAKTLGFTSFSSMRRRGQSG
jgi:hypothetical protein